MPINFLEALFTLDSLNESKEDQERFISKFGEDRFNRFNKLKSKLANVKDAEGKVASTDITYHVKHTELKDLDALLDRAEGRQYVANKAIEYDMDGDEIPAPANTKKLVGETANYKIYKVTDYTDAIDLARQKIKPNEEALGYWCIAGRYQLGDDDAVKVSQARRYFEEYLMSDYDNYYFCMPKDTAENKIVVCAYVDTEDGLFAAFDAYDNQIGEADFPTELYHFEDPDNGFAPQNIDEDFDHGDEEEEPERQIGLDVYYNDYYDDTAWVISDIKQTFTDFDVAGVVYLHGRQANVFIDIEPKLPEDKELFPVQLSFQWVNVEYWSPDAYYSDFNYQIDDTSSNRRLYSGHFDDDFNEDGKGVHALYHMVCNLHNILRAIKTAKEEADKDNRELSISLDDLDDYFVSLDLAEELTDTTSITTTIRFALSTPDRIELPDSRADTVHASYEVDFVDKSDDSHWRFDSIYRKAADLSMERLSNFVFFGFMDSRKKIAEYKQNNNIN